MAEHFCLKWNNYRPNLTSAFKSLRENEDFVDVTLSADGINLKAHKVVLSACSNYFRDLLRGISVWQHPVLFLRDIPLLDLSLVLEFVYVGEVSVSQTNLQSFLKTAGLLRIKGLAEDDEDGDYTKMKRPASRTDQRGEEASRKRRLELSEPIRTLGVKHGEPIRTLGAKMGSKAKLAKTDTNQDVESVKGETDDITLKQEPLDPEEENSDNPQYSDSELSAGGSTLLAVEGQPGLSVNPSVGYGDMTRASHQTTDEPELNGMIKKDLEGKVICHVCRAVLSNTNALCYHMNYVHSAAVQNIDMIRGLGAADSALKEEEQ